MFIEPLAEERTMVDLIVSAYQVHDEDVSDLATRTLSALCDKNGSYIG